MVEMSVLGISLQEGSGAPVLLLHPDGTRKILTLSIGPLEAFAISAALHGPEKAATGAGGAREGREAAGQNPSGLFPRPLTHDLLLAVLDSLGGVLKAVTLLSVVNGVFIAEAVIANRGPDGAHFSETRVDCRPSDGIALALRCNAVIQATSAVLAHAEDIDAAMAALPQHVRVLAEARLAALGAPDGPAATGALAPPDKNDGGKNALANIPQAIAAVLAAKGELSGRDPGRELITLARKMLEDEQDGKRKQEELAKILSSFEAEGARGDAPGAPPPLRSEMRSETQVITLVPEKHDGPGIRKNFPQIRFSIIRHPPKGETPFREIPSLPAEALTEDLLTGLGLSPQEQATIVGSPAGDRWAILLRLLSPETKVPM